MGSQLSGFGRACRVGLGDWVVFDAPKSAVIRDWRLGIFSYAIIIAIFLYILVGQVLLNNTFLIKVTPDASVRMTLQQPVAMTNGVPCSTQRASCADILVPLSQLDYCCDPAVCSFKGDQCTCPNRQTASIRNCTYRDGFQVSRVRGKQMLIATMLSRIQGNVTRSSYSALVERYTLLFDHALSSAVIEVKTPNQRSNSVPAASMRGALLVQGSSQSQRDLCSSRVAFSAHPDQPQASRTSTPPCYIGPDGQVSGLDYFALGTLMKAMGLDLDRDGIRSQGLQVTISITYSNTYPLNTGDKNVYYTYQLHPTSRGFSMKEDTWLQYPTVKAETQIVGIAFTVAPTGQLGGFSFFALLSTITNGLVLLALAAPLTNFIVFSVLPLQKYYDLTCTDISPDFDEVHYYDKLTMEELDRKLDDLKLPRVGSREARLLRLLHAARERRPALRVSQLLRDTIRGSIVG